MSKLNWQNCKKYGQYSEYELKNYYQKLDPYLEEVFNKALQANKFNKQGYSFVWRLRAFRIKNGYLSIKQMNWLKKLSDGPKNGLTGVQPRSGPELEARAPDRDNLDGRQSKEFFYCKRCGKPKKPRTNREQYVKKFCSKSCMVMQENPDHFSTCVLIPAGAKKS